MTKEKAAEAIRNTMEPWVNAINIWNAESEKLRQTAIDGMTQTIDNSHKLAKESLAVFTTVTGAARRYYATQVERTIEFVNSLTP